MISLRLISQLTPALPPSSLLPPLPRRDRGAGANLIAPFRAGGLTSIN